MREIKINEISKEIFEAEFIEDPSHKERVEYFEFLIEEARHTKALDFFNITYDEDAQSLNVPKDLNLTDAINTVNQYLARVEADGMHLIDTDSIDIPEDCEEPDDYIYRINQEAERYDEYTEPFRGADDGTFDYAGTFVITILCVIQAVETSK